MSDFNKVILMGRLTAKPELRFTPGGDAVTNLRVASSSSFRSKSGEDKEETCYIDVVVWRKQAETCAEYLVKGQKILVEGRLVFRQWETASGEKRSTYEIQANRVIFLEKPRGESSGGGGGGRPELDDSDVPSPDDDEIPF